MHELDNVIHTMTKTTKECHKRKENDILEATIRTAVEIPGRNSMQTDKARRMNLAQHQDKFEKLPRKR